MATDSEQLGRAAARAILERARPAPAPAAAVEPPRGQPLQFIDQDAATEAIKQVAEARLEQVGDLKAALVAAVKALSVTQTVDIDTEQVAEAVREMAAAQKPIDFTPVVRELMALQKSVDENTKAVRELTQVARTARVVKYDDMGRIIEIGLK